MKLKLRDRNRDSGSINPEDFVTPEEVEGLVSEHAEDTDLHMVGGVAPSATKLATARTINGTAFNGTANIVTSQWGTARTITIGTSSKSVNGAANVTWTHEEMGVSPSGHTHSVATPSASGFMSKEDKIKLNSIAPNANEFHLPAGTNGEVLLFNGTSWVSGAVPVPNIDASKITTGTLAAARIPTLNQNTTGSAGSLATARTINGTAFNGTANITTSLWGTARDITIGSTTKSVNGSVDVVWTLGEIGAASTNHNHDGIYEPAFTKNTAFNKNFGTAAGTVAQGNDSRINNGQTAFGWGNHASQGYVKTDTTYTAGNGLTLSGTTFSLPVTVTGTGTYVQSVTQTATGLTVTLGTPPDNDTRYSEISTAEIDAGTATASKTITGRRVGYMLGKKADVNHTHVITDITGLGTLATISTNNSTSNFLRGDGTWVTPPNSTYSLISTSEIDAGTSTTARLISADRIKHITDKLANVVHSHVADDIPNLPASKITSGTFAAARIPTLNQDTTGNAATATALSTARTINGTAFNGTANITTSLWGTARTLTIGSSAKSVNGGGNVSWSLAEIGAAPTSHSHDASDITSGTMAVERLPTVTAMGGYEESRITISTGNPTGGSHKDLWLKV